MEKLFVGNIRYLGVDIEINFDCKLNNIVGNSGTGKSFLMQAILAYCINNNINCIKCDFSISEKSTETIIEIIRDSDIVLLDNADLYMNDKIMKFIRDNNKMLIMSMKETYGINIQHMQNYIVEYDGNVLTTRKEY